jgi:CheY-like chemotaxis protein
LWKSQLLPAPILQFAAFHFGKSHQRCWQRFGISVSRPFRSICSRASADRELRFKLWASPGDQSRSFVGRDSMSAVTAKRILLVDDETYLTTMLAGKFRKAGFDVTIAGNGEDGLAMAIQNPPDLLITDCQMPLLSGYEMCQKLRQDPRTAQVPVVMLSGHGFHLSADQLAKTNIRTVLDKPFSARDLMEKVNAILAPVNPPPPTPA